MSTTLDSTTTNNHHSSDDRKQSPPAFLDLADSAARYGNNVSDVTVRAIKKMEHERQRALQRKLFEDQMRALEQQQARELLTIESGAGLQHMAASAPTTPPRVNAMLSGEYSPNLSSGLSQSTVDPEVLSRAVGSAADKRKSVTYAPSVNHSPEAHSNNHQSFARSGGAKSMPASRRGSASEHDEELAGHLENLSLVGERRANAQNALPQSILRSASGRFGTPDGTNYTFNAGMMLDEQLDQEMHNAMRHLPTSDEDKYTNGYANKVRLDVRDKPSEWPQFNGNARSDAINGRGERRTVTNPAIALSSTLGDLTPSKVTSSGRVTPLVNTLPQGLVQGISSRRGSPLGLSDGLSITTARSVPTTPLPGAGPPSGLSKGVGTPLSAESQTLNGLLSAQNSSPVELHPSLSRIPSAQYESGGLGYNGLPSGGVDEYDAVYDLNNGLDNGRYNDFGFENGSRMSVSGTAGSTALYHHNGTKYGLGIGARPTSDGKMNGLHGPKHKRGDVDREFNRFAGMRLEDLQGEIPSLCKDQHGCRYLQKKLEEGVPEHRDMIFRETFGHFPELMIVSDPFGNYLCQKLLEYSTDEQRNLICESVAQDLVNISLNMHGTRAVQKMIDFLSTRRQTDLNCNTQIHSIIVALSLHVVVLIKDLNGNHVIQKCLNKLVPEDNQFIYNAVAANCVEVATHRHGCCVLQRCIDHASEPQRVQLVNEITYNALTLVQDPYGNYVVQYILDLNDSRFSDAVIRQFTGNVCALSVQKFSSNVIEKCVRVAEHSTRKILIGELLNRTRLEKLLRDSYGNYCVQTALDYAEPAQRALLVEGIRPVLPLIRNTPYGKRIQNKLQREQVDSYGNYHGQPPLLRTPGIGGQGGHHMSHQGMHHGSPLSDSYGAPYSLQNGLQGQSGLSQLHGGLHGMHGASIDSYVLQNGSNHSPGLTPPHAHSGFAAPSTYGNGFAAMAVTGGMGDPYQRGYGYGM
ncbi:ARM repeat-containing protein [Cytidiella melzeri]|nr:ARM repeat-containing protein [Cytidiella melzeri]